MEKLWNVLPSWDHHHQASPSTYMFLNSPGYTQLCRLLRFFFLSFKKVISLHMEDIEESHRPNIVVWTKLSWKKTNQQLKELALPKFGFWTASINKRSNCHSSLYSPWVCSKTQGSSLFILAIYGTTMYCIISLFRCGCSLYSRVKIMFSWPVATKLATMCTQAVVLKFIYFEKALKICEISTLDVFGVVTVKSTVEVLQNLVAFSKYMNFKGYQSEFLLACFI